tara:strand:- start:409 stop:1359 length:951 start_codon:yes stop_codon:yes gene_type:complete
MTFVSQLKETSWQGEIIEEWRKEVEEYTSGAVKMDFYWPGMLPYKGKEVLTAVNDRLVDGAEGTPHLYGGIEPIMETSYLIYLFENDAEAKAGLQSVVFPHFAKAFEKYNVQVLINRPSSGGFNQWFSKEPVSKLSDMKGVSARAYNKESSDVLKYWGAVPTTIPMVELYQALQRGVVDAVITSASTANSTKFWEILDYITKVAYKSYSPANIMVNKDAWKELPPDTKLIVEALSIKYSDIFWSKALAAEEELWESLLGHGMKIVELEPGEKAKLKAASAYPAWKGWLERSGDDGVAIYKDLEALLGRDILKHVGY